MSARSLENSIRSQADLLRICPEWFHSIQLSPQITTPGRKSTEVLKREWDSLRLPDLSGKTVLDIGAYDGYFSFEAERCGASKVVALDHYVWSADMAGYMDEWRRTRKSGDELPPVHESRFWRPQTLPGRKTFDLAKELLNSRVEPVVFDFSTMDTATIGKFDIVFYLGVLYHMENPLDCLRRLKSVIAPGGLAVLETEAMEVMGLRHGAYAEFFPGRELNNDPTNWWSPNEKALIGLCKAAGFSAVKVYKDGSSTRRKFWKSTKTFLKDVVKRKSLLPIIRYRAVAHLRV
jgi:tRNA (mo5U34)-methyltransferase